MISQAYSIHAVKEVLSTNTNYYAANGWIGEKFEQAKEIYIGWSRPKDDDEDEEID